MAIETEQTEVNIYGQTAPNVQNAPQMAITAWKPPETDDVKELALSAAPLAIKSIVSVMQSPSAKNSDILHAANSILDRAHGKAAQETVVKGDMKLTVVCAIPFTPNSQKVIDGEAVEIG